MNKLHKKGTNILDKPELCPEKMDKVRKVLREQLASPQFDKWDKNDELLLIRAMAFELNDEKYTDIKNMARELYFKYLSSKFHMLPGMKKWEEEFKEVIYEEMIE